jgi:hypothetical protein
MSSLSMLAPCLAGVVATVLAYKVLAGRMRPGHLPLPPGPKPLLFLGNLFDLPKRHEWLTYRAWKERYGDVVYVEALGQKIIILGSADAVNDIMERRGNIYSQRAGSIMICELYVLSLLFLRHNANIMYHIQDGL